MSFAGIIQKRIQFVARNINYILSLLFLVLALSTIYNTFFCVSDVMLE
ncbi:MAG: hypothetical protein IPN20_00855 [Haliscomenobacter sp.]|nr:hypothetical protein [Haliscomenobacter sp.]